MSRQELLKILNVYSGKLEDGKSKPKDPSIKKQKPLDEQEKELSWAMTKQYGGKVLGMMGGPRVAAFLFFMKFTNILFDFRSMRQGIKWAKVKPEKQLEELPKNFRIILVSNLVTSAFT